MIGICGVMGEIDRHEICRLRVSALAFWLHLACGINGVFA